MPRSGVWAAARWVEWLLALGARSGYWAALDSTWPVFEVPTLARVAARFSHLERRLDAVEVIGHALALGIVGGLGVRSVADRVGVPMTTARGWRRRFQLRAPALVAALVAVAVQLDPAPVLLASQGETAVLEALGATWQRARTRFGERGPAMWRFWSLISGGHALGTNRSPPATQAGGAGWMTPSP